MDSTAETTARSTPNVARASLNRYRVTFSFDGDHLTTRELRWALRAFADPGAPAGLRVRFDRAD